MFCFVKKNFFFTRTSKTEIKKTRNFIIINQCLAKGEFYILKIHNTGSLINITKLEAPSESETYMAQIQ